MWSRFNAVGMRQRWGTLEDDPGRTCRSKRSAQRGRGARSDRDVERVKRAFLSGEAVVECAIPGCPGLYITAKRQLGASPGGGSRVALTCTRLDSEHDVTLELRPYSETELEMLRASQERGEAPSCPRCRSALQRTEASGSGSISSTNPAVYECEWCGVRWRPSQEDSNRLAG